MLRALSVARIQLIHLQEQSHVSDGVTSRKVDTKAASCSCVGGTDYRDQVSDLCNLILSLISSHLLNLCRYLLAFIALTPFAIDLSGSLVHAGLSSVIQSGRDSICLTGRIWLKLLSLSQPLGTPSLASTHRPAYLANPQRLQLSHQFALPTLRLLARLQQQAVPLHSRLPTHSPL